MSITYEDALSTLNSMFGEPWQSHHLDFTLRHFEGHMENTVEAILCHGDSSPESLVERLGSMGKGSNVPHAAAANLDTQISMDEELARALEQEDRSTPATSANHGSSTPGLAGFYHPRETESVSKPNPVSSKKKGRGTPTELPQDFLRIPGRKYTDLDADEALARMLQDDLFTEELANNPEFAHLARGRLPSQASRYNQRPRMSDYQNQSQGPNIMDTISGLGDTAKKRLALLAANWNAKTNQQSERRGLLDQNPINDEGASFLEQGMEMKSMPQQQQKNANSWGNKKDK